MKMENNQQSQKKNLAKNEDLEDQYLRIILHKYISCKRTSLNTYINTYNILCGLNFWHR